MLPVIRWTVAASQMPPAMVSNLAVGTVCPAMATTTGVGFVLDPQAAPDPATTAATATARATARGVERRIVTTMVGTGSPPAGSGRIATGNVGVTSQPRCSRSIESRLAIGRVGTKTALSFLRRAPQARKPLE